MPFTSKNQARWAFATGQPWAEDWASKTDFSTLPTSANDRYEDGDEVQKLGLQDLSKYHKYRKNIKLKDKVSNSLRDVLFNPDNSIMANTNRMEKAYFARYGRKLPLNLEAALFGSIPVNKSPYYKGFVGGSLGKQFGNLNASLSLERELLSGKTKVKPRLSYRANFEEGGQVDPPIEKPQINYARQDNTRVSGLGDDYTGEYQDPGKPSTIHDVLNQTSMLPIVGEASDAANALLYAKKGDYENAAYSTAGLAIPFVGGAALKAGAKGVKNWWKGLTEVPDLSKDLYKYPTKSFDPVKEPMFQRSVQGVDAHSVGSYNPYDNKISKTLDPSHKMHSKVGTDYVLPKGMDHAKLNEFAKRIVHGNNPENILSSVDPKLIDDVYNSLVKLNPSLKNIKNINKKDIIHGVASNINSKELFDVVDGINKPGEIKGWEEFVDKNWENPNIKNQGFDFVFSEKRQADILKLRDKGLLEDGGPIEKPEDIQKRMVGTAPLATVKAHRFDPERAWSYDEKGNKVPSMYHAPKQEPFTISAEGTKSRKDKKQFEKDNPYPVNKDFYKQGAAKQYGILEDWETARDDYILDKIIERNPREWHVARTESGEGWVDSFSPEERRYFNKRNMGSKYGSNKWDTGWSAEDQPWYKQTAAGALNLLTTPVETVTGAIDPNISIWEGLTGAEGIMSRDEDTDMAMRIGLDPLMYMGTGVFSGVRKGISNIASKAGKVANKLRPKIKNPYVEGFVDKTGIYHQGPFDTPLGTRGIFGEQPVLVDGKPITNWQYAVNKQVDLTNKLDNARKSIGLTTKGIKNRIRTLDNELIPTELGLGKKPIEAAVSKVLNKLGVKKINPVVNTITKYSDALVNATKGTFTKRLNPAHHKGAQKAKTEGERWIKNWITSKGFKSRFRAYVKRAAEGEKLTPEAKSMLEHQSKALPKGKESQFSDAKDWMFPEGTGHYDHMLRDFIGQEMNKLTTMGTDILTKPLKAEFPNNKAALYDLLSGKTTQLVTGSGKSLGIQRPGIDLDSPIAKWFKGLKDEEKTLVAKYMEHNDITSTTIHELIHNLTKGNERITAGMYNDLVKGFGETSTYITDMGEAIDKLADWTKAAKEFRTDYPARLQGGERQTKHFIDDLDATLRDTWEIFSSLARNNPTKSYQSINSASDASQVSYGVKVDKILAKRGKEFFNIRPQNSSNRFVNPKGDSKAAMLARKEYIEKSEKFFKNIKKDLSKVFNKKHGIRYFNDPTELMARMGELRKALNINKGESITLDDFFNSYVEYLRKLNSPNNKQRGIGGDFLNMVTAQIDGMGKNANDFIGMFNKMLGGAGVTLGASEVMGGEEENPNKYEEGGDVKEIKETEEQIFNVEDREFDTRKFRAGLVAPEAGDAGFDYSLRPRGAGNPIGLLNGRYRSTAVGPYQFIYGENKTKGVNQTLKDIGFKGEFNDFVGNKEWQEKLMDHKLTTGKSGRYPYMATSLIKQYGPGGTKLTSGVEEGKDWSKTGVLPADWTYTDIMALEHFAGHGNMREYLKQVRTGESSKKQLLKQVPGGKNMTLGTYLEKFREGYKNSPKALTPEERLRITKMLKEKQVNTFIPYNTEKPVSTRQEMPREPDLYAEGGEAIIEEEEEIIKIPTRTEEQTVEEIIPRQKKKLTELSKDQVKGFTLWRKGWGIDEAELSRDVENYDVPGYFTSNEWKEPGTSYRDRQWVR